MYLQISKDPSVNKDLAVVVEKDVESLSIEKQIKKSAGALLSDIKVFDVYTGSNIGENKKSIEYALTFSAKDKTLTDEEINTLLEKIIVDLEKNLKAELRK